MNSKVATEYEFISAALFSIATQAASIARGLENIAPSASSAGTGSIHYLHAVASQLNMESAGLMPRAGEDAEQSCGALIRVLQQIIQQDTEYRDKYQVGNRFRFVKDRLQELLHTLEERAAEESSQIGGEQSDLSVQGLDDVGGELVFIYLYNAQGALLRTWSAMLTPRAFYEYSVHRPVFLEKKSIEDVLAQKSNPLQHAYMTVMVSADDILTNEDVVRVKEGSLKLDKLMLFTHNGQDYIFVNGELVKKV